jgi:hypothetical protein
VDPGAGTRVRKGWSEVADFNDNVMQVGLGGGTLSYRNQELTLHRSGVPEQVKRSTRLRPASEEMWRRCHTFPINVEGQECQRLGDFRRNTLRRRIVFSASSEARDRSAPTNANQIRLQTSRTRQEHRPIRYLLPARLSFR